MEVILSTAFGVKSETQTVENDPVTEMAKKAMAPNPIFPLLSKDIFFFLLLWNRSTENNCASSYLKYVLLLIWNTLKNICLLHLLPPWQMCPVNKLISPRYTWKMSLESDWPRAMQFLVNTVQKWRNIMQKQGNKMQISRRWEHRDWLIDNRNILEPIVPLITQHQHGQIRWVPGYERAISKVSRVTVKNRFH